jgi:hypothetical protein
MVQILTMSLPFFSAINAVVQFMLDLLSPPQRPFKPKVMLVDVSGYEQAIDSLQRDNKWQRERYEAEIDKLRRQIAEERRLRRR